MSALTGSGDGQNDYYRQQSNFIGSIVQFARQYGVHVMLVAHPRKEKGTLSKEDVRGGSGITDRVDYVYSVERFDEEDIADNPELSQEDSEQLIS